MHRKNEQELGNVDDSDGPYQRHAIAQNTWNRVNRRILVKTRKKGRVYISKTGRAWSCDLALSQDGEKVT